jgi:hypothetical protein
MTVFRLQASENALALYCPRESDFSQTRILDGRRLAENEWAPLQVGFIRDGSAGSEPSDLLMLGTYPALSVRAVEVLSNVVFAVGQVLPLRSDDGEFYLWNVTNIVDALDEAGSEVTRFSSGNIMMVSRWSFRGTLTDGEIVFKVPQLLRGFTFVTDAFLSALQETDLAGFAPERLWPAANNAAG